MRLLVHGMQSSGATAFALFLAQRPGIPALVDIGNPWPAPTVPNGIEMLAKTVITTRWSLQQHQQLFRPDRTILLIRDPRDNLYSLATKDYRDSSGSMAEKFQILEQLFQDRDRFDAVIHYEDFVARDPAVLDSVNRLGWPVDATFYRYQRRHEEILADLWAHLPHLFSSMQLVFGNVRGQEVTARHRDKPRSAEQEAMVRTWCPRLLAHYQQRNHHTPARRSMNDGGFDPVAAAAITPP